MVSQVYKSFTKWVMDWVNTLMSIIKVIILSKKTAPFPEPVGDTCLVLGTGPSLKTSFQKHPEYFKDKTLMCVNTFAVTDEYTALKPTYYFILDPGLWHSDAPFTRQTSEAIIEKTSWPVYLFAPRAAKGSRWMTSIMEGNKNLIVIFFNYVVFKGFESISHYFFRKNLAMPQSQNVLVGSIFMAINMGYKRVEIFGADHNWHENIYVSNDNLLCIKQVHFYEKEEQISYLPYYKVAHSKEIQRVDEAFYAWAKVFHGYVKMKSYAAKRGTLIYNASEVSFIDAFERIKIS